MAKLPKALSPGEEAFALHCRAEGLSPLREWPVCPGRLWRFDFAFPEIKLAIEIEGGIFTQGGHTRGQGYQRNLEKYNMAARRGWVVLRYSTDMVLAGTAINDVLEVIRQK